MSDREWLASLKPGDKAVVPGRWSGPGEIVTVERLTKTQFVMTNGSRFTRDSGRSIGSRDTWHTGWLRPVTPEFLERIEQKRLASWLEDIARKRDLLSIETLRALKAAYEAANKEGAV
jgi:hypothetical protein